MKELELTSGRRANNTDEFTKLELYKPRAFVENTNRGKHIANTNLSLHWLGLDITVVRGYGQHRRNKSRCTEANHTSRQCRNNFIKCNECKGRHTTGMCDPNFIKSNNSNDTSGPVQIQLNSCNLNSSTSLSTNERFQNVWLQTACAFISNSGYSRMKDNLIRLVIDGDAQLTVIKEDIPGKFNYPIIDHNFPGSLARVKSLTSKLIRNSALFEFDSAVRGYTKSGCAEMTDDVSVSTMDIPQNITHLYFMPHQPVYREDKTTTKLQVVFDASVHAPGFASLNELLNPGENLIPEIVTIFMNSRVGNVAVISGIEKAFLQIVLVECDRDSHRFLWYSSKLADVKNLSNLTRFRMTRVTSGVTSSPFFLAAVTKHHLPFNQKNTR
ncbi:hypothetical protein JTB14_029120 [Gonioctena quinquepunctata]|nr:hypothetical protein JTB14_029120 [Gonioctena quinquepunctata]